MTTRTFREEKKQKQCRVFFDVIFDVYTPVETQTMQTADCRLQTADRADCADCAD